MKRFYGFCILMLALCVQFQVFAQGRTVTGTIADDGEPLPGVSIVVTGTTVGTVTDIDGKFSLQVPADAKKLTVSYVGYDSQTLDIGSQTTFNVNLKAGVDLEEVVVTALNISREKKALGYSVQQVGGDDLTGARDANVLNALSGKVSGVQITGASGSVGSSSRVVIRGSSSIRGDSQPLFVINGVPIDNGTYHTDDGLGSVDYGNAASDLNPEDIESLTVLKGPNASALYGSRATNGVILITTKTGKGARKGWSVDYSGNVAFSNPFKLPDYQNKFGQGVGHQFSYVDGAGGGLNDGVDESWGPSFDTSINENDGIDNDGDGEIDETGEAALLDQYSGAQQPWVAQPDNVRDIFETGVAITNNVAISSNAENVHARLSYTNVDQTGMVPNTDYKKNSVNLNFGVNVGPKIDVESNIIYTNTSSDNRPGTGYAGDNILQQFIWSGRQIDTKDLRANWNTFDEYGNVYNWNHNYQNNPFFTLFKNVKPTQRDRITGHLGAGYKITDWMTLKGKVMTDLYSENRKRIFAQGTADYPSGRFEEDEFYVKEFNSEITLNIDRKLSDDLNLNFIAGANHRKLDYTRSSITVESLTVPDIYNVGNANGNPLVEQVTNEKEVNSVFGMLSLGFKDFLFLDVTGRNDWASTLPVAENSYFYPSVNLSLSLVEALGLSSNFDLLKVRGSWAQVGSDTDPYRLATTFQSATSWNGVPRFTEGNNLPPAVLKPERTTSIEVGLESRMFLNRVGLDVTYYNAATDDQILSVDSSPTTGYSFRTLNAGTIENNGVEVMLNVTPIKTTDFSWDLTLNWSKNTSTVKDLPDGVDAVRIGRYWGLDLEAREGQPYGTFRGGKALYHDGQLVLDGGLPQLDPEGNAVLGNIQPDWLGGIRNSFSYKNLDMSFLIDIKKGGDIFSMTNMWGRYSGVLEESLEGRNTTDEIMNGYVYEGVIDNGDGTYRPNDVPMDAESWNAFFYYALAGHDRSVFDGGYIKLREVTLNYRIPSSVFKNTPIQRLSLGVYGRNLWLIDSNAPHIDPETSFGNEYGVQGFEFGQLPSARTFGITLSAGF
ncbi:MAG: SusC/RagA family TonB-linked outer membrane protein [Chitinophagales bacterium]